MLSQQATAIGQHVWAAHERSCIVMDTAGMVLTAQKVILLEQDKSMALLASTHS